MADDVQAGTSDTTPMPASQLSADDVANSSQSWQHALPGAASFEELAAIVRAAPADSYYDIYHPLPFPALDGLRTAVDLWQFRRKCRIIADAIGGIRAQRGVPGAAMKIVDIGANSGGVSFALALDGYQVRAVEPDPKYFQLARATARISGVPVEIRRGTMEHAVDDDERFDVGILLSVFQWAAKGGRQIEAAGRALRALSLRCDHMIFEQGFNKGTSCFTTDNPDHYQELLVMLTRHTAYSDFRLLPSTELYPGQVRYLVHCSGRR